MRIGYADPPYPGKAKKHYAAEAAARGAEAKEVNHRVLVGYLCDQYPDGWALSTNATTLQALLKLDTMPTDVRISPWVKTFTSFNIGVNPAYAWEPVIWRGGRTKRSRTEPTVRDWLAAAAPIKTGTAGAKPKVFSFWLFDLLGLRPEDEFDDLFPGSGAVTRAWETFRTQARFPAA